MDEERPLQGGKPLPERLAAKLWRNRKGGPLRTLEGKTLRVLYPGRPNGGPGPDFKDALVQPEGSATLRGDVEVHRQASSWEGHGHRGDPRYNNVVLHLVYGGGPQPPTYRQDGQPVPVARFSTDDAGIQQSPVQGAWAEQQLAAWRAMPPEAREQALARLGEERFLQRSAAFRLATGGTDAEQALYRGLMEALGYSRNRKPFLELAHRVPWDTVRAAACAAPPEGRAAVLEALLLDGSGLETSGQGVAVGVTPMARSTWQLGGIRPQNHPKRRIAGAALLFARAAQDGLAATFEARLRESNGATLIASLEAARDGTALIGRDRALDMAVNVALPFLHARALLGGDEALAGASLWLYRGAPNLADNELLREAAYLLGAPQAALGRTACQQQGALHLYKRLLQEGDAHIYGAPAGEGRALGDARRRYAPALFVRLPPSVACQWLPA